MGIERVCRLLVWLYPPGFRKRFGRDLADVLADRLTRPTETGLVVWMRVLLDLIRGAAAEWSAEALGGSSRVVHPGQPQRGAEMDAFVQDLRYGVRALVQRPAFTLVATITLALGIGANSVIFSVVDAVIVRPMPFPNPGRLVVMWEANHRMNLPFMNVAPPNFADWQQRLRSFDAMGAWVERSYTIAGDDVAEQVYGAALSRGLLEVLRIDPLMGRIFTVEEDRPGGSKVVLVSYGFWRRRLASNPDAVGTTILVNGEMHEIVGVMPPAFGFPPPVAFEGVPPPKVNELWTPLAIDFPAGQRGAHYLLALGRLREGVTVEDADREIARVAADIARERPDTNSNWSARVVPLDRQVTGDQRPALVAVSIAVGLVLLLACANVASLLLARAVGRRREMAIRVALGASRLRVLRQLLTESLLLSLLGGLAGLLLASWLVRSIRGIAGPMLPRLDEVVLDVRALLFTAAASVVAAALFGLAPAVQASRARAQDSLKDRGSAGLTTRLQSMLVVVELALSVVLLAGAALVGESFVRLLGTDPGFRAERTLTAHVALPASRYPDHAATAAFIDRTTTALAGTAGIAASATIDALALADDRQGTGFSIDDVAMTDLVTNANVNFAFVSPGYFEAMGIPIVRGRGFDGRDRPESTATIVINEEMARRYFGDADPIGRRIRMGFNTQTPREIVGVVGDERHATLENRPPPGVYVSHLQYGWSRRLTLIARTAGDPRAAISTLRQIVRDVDPLLALYDVRTMEQIVNDSVSRPRFSALLLGLFASTALLLAAVGVFGVISQLVGQRTPEFGVRMAVGAAPRDVATLVLRYGLKLALLGILIGVPAAIAFSRLLVGLVYGVSPWNPATYLAVGLTLGIIAVLSALVPARRAMRIDPIGVLRE